MLHSRHAILKLLATVCGLVLFLGSSALAAQQSTGFLSRVYRDDAGEHNYVVFVPRHYTPARQWPVILYLHGASERGTDGSQPTTVGLGPYVKAHAETFPFIVVFPQAEDVRGRALTGWSADSPDGQRALKILDQVEQEFRIDTSREILTGWSMGGYGTWSIAAATPQRWAAIVPVAGAGKPAWAERLKDIPTWALHGADDRLVPPERSQEMIAALKQAGAEPRYTELSEIGHEVWRVVYGHAPLYEWMLAPNPDVVPPQVPENGSASETTTVLQPLEKPFIPSLVIPNAISVRLGNDVLKAISYSVPRMVPRDALSGRIPDIHDQTQAAGRTFDVTFTNIGYFGQLHRASIQAYARDRLNIQLGLRNVTLTIGTTYVNGRSRSAVAGPIRVVIGHRRPVWLSFDVMPYADQGRLRLRFLGARFNIPSDNWYVTPPAGVSTEGLGMTRRRVSDGLVNGLYGSKSRIEREVISAVPTLLQHLEQNLQWQDTSGLVDSFWPLPVYHPRLHVWPQEVAVDAEGVSVAMGVTAAAIRPDQAPRRPKTIPDIGVPAAEIPRTSDLRIGIAPKLLAPLTEQLIDAGLARVHVLDIPQGAFSVFADRETLTQLIPDLARYGDEISLQAELVLKSPISISHAPQKVSSNEKKPHSSADGSHRMEFQVPQVVIQVSLKRTPEQPDWTPLAELEFELTQQAQLELLQPNFTERALQLDWSAPAQITATAHFASDYQPEDPTIDVERIQKLFADAWQAWIAEEPITRINIDDVTLGETQLRLNEAGWSSPNLYAVFSEPGVKITNRTDEPLIYHTQGPYSGWSHPITLQPERSHRFRIPYPLLFYRQSSRGTQTYTLPVGSHSEFRVPKTGGPPQLFQAE